MVADGSSDAAQALESGRGVFQNIEIARVESQRQFALKLFIESLLAGRRAGNSSKERAFCPVQSTCRGCWPFSNAIDSEKHRILLGSVFGTWPVAVASYLEPRRVQHEGKGVN